jgi:hypothetical protein
MTKKMSPKGNAFDRFKLYVDLVATVAMRIIGHGEYALSFNDSGNAHKGDDEKSSVRAEVYINTVYLTITITTYPKLFELYQEGRYREVSMDILHEVCHLLTEPMARLMTVDAAPSQDGPYREVVERQTQRCTNLAAKAMPNGWYEPAMLEKAFLES